MKQSPRVAATKFGFSPIVCALLAVSGTARSQSTPETVTIPPAAEVQKDESGLPLTKVVVDRKQIESGSEQEGYTDAVRNVPGAMSNNGKGNPNDALRFRGLQLNQVSNYRINGGLAIANVVTTPTENKEKVEALKGANALMYGLASPAGILNLITKRPKDVATANVSGNSFGQYGAAIDLGRRWGDLKQYGARINASGTHYETGVKGIGGRGEFFSFAGDWNPTGSLAFKVDFETYGRHVVEQGGVVPPTAVNGVIAVPRVPDPRNLLSGTWDVYTPHTENMIARADYTLSDSWNFSLEGGSSRSHRSRTQVRILVTDLVTGDAQQNVVYQKDQRFNNYFSRFEAHGKLNTWGLTHELTLGYSTSERDSNGASNYAPNAANNNRPINIYAPAVLGAPIDPNTAVTYKPTVSKDTGPYFYDTIGFSRDVKLLVGMRKTSYDFSQTLVAGGPSTTTKYSPQTKGIGILWDFAQATTVYSSYMQSMEDGSTVPAGPIQGKFVTNANAVLPPAIATQKEIGIRSGYLPGVFVNLDYFDIIKKNTNFVPDSPTSVVQVYDGNLHLYGFELQATAQATKRLSISSSAQLMKAMQNGGTTFGYTTENTPKSIIGLNAEYRTPWVNGLSLRGGAAYVSHRYIGNLEQGRIPGYTLYQLGGSYDLSLLGRKSSLNLSIENLSNKRYWASATSSAFGPGMDRSLRFTLRTDL